MGVDVSLLGLVCDETGGPGGCSQGSLLAPPDASLLWRLGLLRVPVLALQEVDQAHHPAAPLPDYSAQNQAD